MQAALAMSAGPSSGSRLDSKVHAGIARLTASISPTSIGLAWMDWATQLALSPGKRLDLLILGCNHWLSLNCYCQSVALTPSTISIQECIVPPSFDKRFKADEWHRWPFNVIHQAFLLTDQWWHAATNGVRGVSRHHEHIVSFIARQWLDMLSPGNYPLTNPVVLRRTSETWGHNLIFGAINLLEDIERITTNKPPAHANRYRVGLNLAKTPGKVILRNRLAELIQYQPTTSLVKPEPVLIIPAWIMKYYILDLSPHNSLIKHLVDQGYTVFCLSWKNPGLPERDLELDDYLQLGVFQALSAINKILPNQKVHATGYCLGGTLLAIAAAAMAREHDDRLKSITLFTTQTDFRESGELALFIDENEVSLLEAQMEETGYLSAGQMAGAFQMLRSNDLMWSRMIHEYLMGERAPVSDLMAWNADTTRMPARMHGRYLRELFLNNALSEGRYQVHGEPITLFNIQLPIFCVATTADHVTPWRSVYKLHYLTPAEITFVLTTGGHNAGIVNSPERTDRSYQILCRPAAGHYIDHQQWLQQAPQHAGSWWPAWINWLNHSSSTATAPPLLGLPGQDSQQLADAPGAYVFEN
ncbi:MAG: alpha/beta fold hydrolase [Betaproteobacteria bacterium]|nr:alpha/beta fold hydrolase [Betaproteobacteria bacterium]